AKSAMRSIAGAGTSSRSSAESRQPSFRSRPRNVAASRRDREQQAREAVRRARDRLPFLFSKEHNRQLFRIGMEGQPIDWLLAAARQGDPDAIEVLRDRVRTMRRAGATLSPDANEFFAEFFIDGPPKAKPGTKSTGTDVTYVAIATFVKLVNQDFGIPIDSG